MRAKPPEIKFNGPSHRDRMAGSGTTENQVKVGGPRAGSGGAARAATCGRPVDASAASDTGCAANARVQAGGGAPASQHKGHSIWCPPAWVTPLSSTLKSLTTPEAEHTICHDGGLISGDATATPSANTNHASTRRARCRVERGACIAAIILDANARSSRTACTPAPLT